MPNPPKCPGCGNEMRKGFLVEVVHQGGGLRAATWMSGDPPEWPMNNKKFAAEFFSLNRKDKFEVSTYRCLACGLLQSYALKKYGEWSA
ncbi:MAG: PF20097 family protein [Verrucomicrobia bacterium]|nr:PF20097 family protein [Verrucomicrobiota bacterium]